MLGHPDVEIVVNLTIPAAHVEVATRRRPRRQARLEREAVLAGPRQRPRAAEGSRRRRAAARLRPGHLPRRRAADRPAADRTRRHRHAADRPDPDAVPRPGILAPEPRVPVPGRRRARCSTSARTTSPPWSRPSAPSAGWQRSAPSPAKPGSSVPGRGRRGIRRHVPTHVSAIAAVRRRRIRPRASSASTHRSARRLRGDHRHRRHDRAAGPEQLRRRHPDLRARLRGLDRRPVRRLHRRPRHRRARTWPAAIRAGRPHRATGELAFHVLDTMASISESIDTRAFVDVESSAARVPALPEDWDPTASTL